MFADIPTGHFVYIPQGEFDRLRASPAEPSRRTALFAQMARFNALYAITRAGSGHIGSSFSSLDIVSWLYLQVLDPTRDIYYSSKGHDAPGLYAVLTALGRLDFERLHTLRRLGGLPGHPDVGTPGMVCNTGSLGMGVSKAKGMVFANRLAKRPGSIYVLTGDGELQEGQFWESLQGAANHHMGEITVIVDHNKLQSDTFVSLVSDLGDLAAKFAAFGWAVARCDGHDVAALERARQELARFPERPKAIIADTIKGRGVSFMEPAAMAPEQRYYKFHSGAPGVEQYRRAVEELAKAIGDSAAALALAPIRFESVPPAPAAGPDLREKLVPHYSEALLRAAERDPSIVALDADLILDTGLIPFRERFPERFFECGIAEQDMVSMASGMALRGLRPVVHSFACFLSARPNEQIYNAATEGTKIIYVGSLAGLAPAGPGHSHQAVRDVSSLAAVPKLSVVEPSLPDEVEPLLRWCLDEAPGSCYLRLVSAPTLLPPVAGAAFVPRCGWGRELVDGSGLAFVAYGPTLVAEAQRACVALRAAGLPVGLFSFPWLNHVAPEWLQEVSARYRGLLVLENHYPIGGLFDRMAAAAVALDSRPALECLAVDRVPECGTNEQAIRAHGLDADSLAEAARRMLAGR